MTAHLTALERDEASAGLGLAPEAQAHLADCAACTAAVAALRSQGEELLSTAPAQRLRARLAGRPALRVLEGGVAEVATPAPRPAWARRAFAVAGLALAAGLAAVVLLRPPDDTVRLKGRASVEVLDASGAPRARAKAGERVTLAVGSGGRTHAAVFALDAAGEVQQLWPQGSSTAAVAAGARVPLSPGFEVTAGAVGLYAAFTDAPIDTARLREAVREAFAAARKAGHAQWELTLQSPGVLWAQAVLEVEP